MNRKEPWEDKSVFHWVGKAVLSLVALHSVLVNHRFATKGCSKCSEPCAHPKRAQTCARRGGRDPLRMFGSRFDSAFRLNDKL